jgi:cobalt-zinc-cadmium resistance protein CzcA
MFKNIVNFAVRKKLFVAITMILLLLGGVYAMVTLPVDAVPDITNNQVQVVTVSPTLAPQEVEQLITSPVEIAMRNIMNVKEIRSVSRFGLSVVTVVFDENVPTLDARQLVNEQIQSVTSEIPSELGTPSMMPITTGLGEIYQYVLKVDPKYKNRYNAAELRTVQDWIVKRQLSGISGIVEINSFGGYLKQYEVAVDPDALYSLDITIGDVFSALSANNQNTGGSYIEKINRAYYIRSEGMIHSLKDIESVVITNRGGIPIHIGDVAKVRFGAAKRFGAMTMDGTGECVGGIAMMLKGANANVVTGQLEERVAKVQKMLPPGITIEPYLNRSQLVTRNISTVVRNLIEGAIIVFLVLIIFLGDVRAGLIVASVIPFAMLFGFIMMRIFGVTANLMSLGAIDFGIVVDGSIVVLEGIMAHLYFKPRSGLALTQTEMDGEVIKGAGHVVSSATFAVLIILIVFCPILFLSGIEGKYFTPMAKTLVFCIIGALFLSLTYIPMMASIFLKKKKSPKKTFSDRFFNRLNIYYHRTVKFCLHNITLTIGVAFGMLILSLMLFGRLGAEFIPTMDEGDFAMQMTLPAGSSLTKSLEQSRLVEKTLKDKFPEVKHVVAKIGTAEVPTDPMAVEDADIMIIMKPFKEWTSAKSRDEMLEKMKKALEPVKGAEYNFSQPIQLRFNELMTGAKTDIAVKLFGESTEELYKKAGECEKYIKQIPGASDVIVEQTMGLPQLVVKYDRKKIAQYGVNIEELNALIRTAYAGEATGVVFENERRFDLVVRLDKDKVPDLDIDRLFVRTADGAQIPVSEVATVSFVNGPLQINREETKRRIVIGVNVRNADIQQVVTKIQSTLEKNVKLKPGYYFEYGGQFENLQNAIHTLSIVIPIALMLILLLLFFAFRSVTYALLVFTTVPLSLIGGIVALWLRGLPFSISAGVGFIALFGVAVLNGILMINNFNVMRKQNKYTMCTDRVIMKCIPHLLRPVTLTGLVASLGFVPMAIAKSAGAEIQRPLATVVIGGLIVSTMLTLIIIPTFYRVVNAIPVMWKRKFKSSLPEEAPIIIIAVMLSLPALANAQTSKEVSLDSAVQMALRNNPRMLTAGAAIDMAKAAKGQNWEPGSTEFNYSWGQINGTVHSDNQFSVTQPLGSFFTPHYKNALVKTRMATGQHYKDMVKKEITAEVKRAWAYYQYTYNIYSLCKNQGAIADKLLSAGNIRYEQGDITQLERKMTTSLASSIKTRMMKAEEELRLAEKQFQWACYSRSLIVPDDTTLAMYVHNADNSNLSNAHLQYFRSMADEKMAEMKLEKSKFLPEFSVGYVLQKISPSTGLSSWMVGVSVPLFFGAQASRVKQSKIGAYIADTEARDNEWRLRNKVEELQSRMKQEEQNINYFKTAALQEADALLQNAQVEFKESETDISQFVQSINSAYDIHRNYIETVYNYNIAVIELELYTE